MKLFTTILFLLYSTISFAQSHPDLVLTTSGVKSMRSAYGGTPLFDVSVDQIRDAVDKEIANGIEVPLPKDLAGGYTHERHKANFFSMQKAGVLFQITQEDKYANYIKDMLLQYAALFPKFEKHPIKKSYARGKFFWQCLNDANWLVYTSQAYDCIYDWLDKKTIKKLNRELFRPYAEFISKENPQFFNRIHNHSTWGNAAVGMIGLVMQDDELVSWALNGLSIGVSEDLVDNDGGSIKQKNQKEAGFFAQLDHSFSPDGYYTEGPYYQRYAMYPFLIFAQSLANKMPQLNILSYREDLLIKAVYTLIDQTNAAGEFFPINDAQKGMSLASRELVNAISMAYFYGSKDERLLSLVQSQGRVPINDAGLAAATAIENKKLKPYKKRSRLLKDGKDGDEGAIGILKGSGESDITLLLKYPKHGMGHGHFDRLGFLMYDGKEEVFQDYGAARWVNIEYKDGGGYLKENKSWAKQTVAHNALVINRTSQFSANVKKADKTHGYNYLFDSTQSNIQVVSGIEPNAYEDWKFQRTMALIDLPELENPLTLDLLNVVSSNVENETATFELPFYYVGELMNTNLEVVAEEILKPMGEKYGYQHLWKEASAVAKDKQDLRMTWFNGSAFYTMHSALQSIDEVYFTRIGANDAEFNLRRDPGIMIHRQSGNTVFAQTYEVHGSYNTSTEIPKNLFSSVKNVQVLFNSDAYIVTRINLVKGSSYTFYFSLKSNDAKQNHHLKIGEKEHSWTGTYNLKKIDTK